MSDEDDRPPTRRLSEEECWRRIAAAPYGRIATHAAGELDVFPVNHAVAEGVVVFRTSPGTKLLELTIHRDVVFQVDGSDEVEAFSVVVKGEARELQTEREIGVVAAAGVDPWAPEEKDRWVRIVPRTVTGIAFLRRLRTEGGTAGEP